MATSLLEVEHGSASSLELVARPLLRVMQFISGLETTFITQIDWDRNEQDVLYSLNTADMQVGEGGTVAWSDSMCKIAFDSGYPVLQDVRSRYPTSLGATNHAMDTFFAVPIVSDNLTIGSVCGASRRAVEITSDVLEQMRNISESLAHQMATELVATDARERALVAELTARHAQKQAGDYADLAASMENLALSDPLTGLGNRRAFEVFWRSEVARAESDGYPISLMAIDIDNFKRINDTFGHAAGDDVLRAVASAIKEITRSEDIAFRFGGDEFVLTTPRAGVSSSRSIAQRIASDFARRTDEMGMPASISIGIACTEVTPAESLGECADKALYLCKQAGRNQVDLWGRIDR